MALFGKKKTPVFDPRDDPALTDFIATAIRQTGREPTEQLRLSYLSDLRLHIKRMTAEYLEILTDHATVLKLRDIMLQTDAWSRERQEFLERHIPDFAAWQREVVNDWEQKITTEKRVIPPDPEYAGY